jgi:hypothetical protein
MRSGTGRGIAQQNFVQFAGQRPRWIVPDSSLVPNYETEYDPTQANINNSQNTRQATRARGHHAQGQGRGWVAEFNQMNLNGPARQAMSSPRGPSFGRGVHRQPAPGNAFNASSHGPFLSRRPLPHGPDTMTGHHAVDGQACKFSQASTLTSD